MRDLKKLANDVADRMAAKYSYQVKDVDQVKQLIREAIVEAIYHYESAQTRDAALNGF